jgi:diguanylate cyclase (GGDEF)-like protein/PAS domain S-box-containing protein
VVRDITERKREISERHRAELALRESEARLRAILDAVGEGIVTCDESGLVESVNGAAVELFGRDAEDIVGASVGSLIAEPARAAFLGLLTLEDMGGGAIVQESLARHLDGTVFPVEFNADVMELGDRRVRVISFRDVSERRAYVEALEHQALHDALTGLPNRLLFGDRVTQAIAAAQRNRTGFGLLLLDLDRFKEVNDTLGHQQGDALLRAIAERLRANHRDVDTVARLGGDEFGILPTGVADRDGLLRAARGILALMQEPFVLEGQLVDAAVSVGIAVYPAHGPDVSTLVRHADVAMYVAKRRGLGAAVYDPEQDENAAHRLALLGRLRRAIAHDELVLHYQPQVSIDGGAVRAVEALVRWRTDDEGLLPPLRFLPLAEQSDLIGPLTTWVLDQSLRQLADWRRRGLELDLAVNATTRNLQDRDFPATVARLLRVHGVAPEHLTLEITESSAMSPQALAGLDPLYRTGVALAIDDFGTGYSSLAYLKRLPVTQIKIDRSFIVDLARDHDDAAIVRPTISLGHNLGLTVVAEGVEDLEALELLRDCGCDLVQGFLVSPALPPEELEPWAREGPWSAERQR